MRPSENQLPFVQAYPLLIHLLSPLSKEIETSPSPQPECCPLQSKAMEWEASDGGLREDERGLRRDRGGVGCEVAKYPKVPFHPTPLWEVWVPDSRSTTARAQHLPALVLWCSSLASGPTVLQIIVQRQEGVLLMMPRPRRSIRCFTLTVSTLQTALTAEPPLCPSVSTRP